MKTVIPTFLACTVLSVLSQPLSLPEAELWKNFKNDFQKNYTNQEEEMLRQKVFLGNIRAIEEHNKLFEQGKVTFSLMMNQYGDLSNEEFRKRMNGFKMGSAKTGSEVYKRDDNEALPVSFDWRTKGAVTEVKNQGECGSCWAFSSTGSLEGAHLLKTGKLVSLSEQNLIDCSSAEGNEGCNGGLMTEAFDYVKKNGGIDTEKSYPYEGKNELCAFKKTAVGATIKGYTSVKNGSETDLQAAVAKVGPVSVAIDASSPEFQFYHEGIYYSASCSSEELDHGVLVIGYGTDSTGDYWIVKNSWGTNWGEKGYVRMARNKENNCGIASMASFPTV